MVLTASGIATVHMQKILLEVVLFIVATAVPSFPQNIESVVRSSKVPVELQSTLVSRFSLFLNAQIEGDWNGVFLLRK